MSGTELFGSTHVALEAGRMIIIDVCRDAASGMPALWLKVGTADVEYQFERASVTNFTINLETIPARLDDADLREQLALLVSNPTLVSEVMLAVRKQIMLAERSSIPTLRVRALSERERNEVPRVIPEEPTTAVSSTLKK